MRVIHALLLTCLLYIPRHCMAQTGAGANGDQNAAAASDAYSVEPAYKFIFGTGRYRSNEISADLYMPDGLSINADYDYYRSDISSATKIFTLGADKSFGQYSFGANATLEPRQNDFKSGTLELTASYHTDSKDFRTTLTAALSAMNDSQDIRVSSNTKEMNVSQRSATIGIKQQFFDTRIKAEFSGYGYSPDISSYSLQLARWEAKLNRSHPRLYNRISGAIEGANGVLTGYPDWSAKLGLYHDLDALPVPLTIWGKYENTHFLAAYEYRPPAPPIRSLISGMTADSLTCGIDIDFGRQISGTLQYNHVRETGQPAQELYGLSLSAMF